VQHLRDPFAVGVGGSQMALVSGYQLVAHPIESRTLTCGSVRT
jgi:hypothetical protein